MAGTTELLLGIGLIGAKEEAPATLPADFFSSEDASATNGETPQPRPAAERAGELQDQSDRLTPSPIPSKWVN